MYYIKFQFSCKYHKNPFLIFAPLFFPTRNSPLAKRSVLTDSPFGDGSFLGRTTDTNPTAF